MLIKELTNYKELSTKHNFPHEKFAILRVLQRNLIIIIIIIIFKKKRKKGIKGMDTWW